MCLFAMFVVNSSAVFSVRVWPQREFDCLSLESWWGCDQRVIDLVDFTVSEKRVQFPVRCLTLCQDHNPAGFFIQSMYHPQRSVDRFQYASEVGLIWVIAIWHAEQSRWFINHQEVLVLIDYYREIGRNCFTNHQLNNSCAL